MLTASIFPKQKLLYFGWYHHQCVNLKIFKSKITHWVLSEKVTNTQITHTSLTLCTFAALTRLKLYWWKNLTRVWGNLLERPLTLLPSTSSEQFKNLRVARHKVHIPLAYTYIVWSKKLAVSCVQRLALGHAYQEKINQIPSKLLTHLILWLIHFYAYSCLK